ncbi:MAG: type III-A CRISPR-associated protein Csm2 [Lachnospiraceae bacterium]|nr:type III-A CRISPR-associated protein Csm2 [Lachnospiraceae bacterium]
MATGRDAFIKAGYVDNSNKTENKGRHINLNYIEGGYFNENGTIKPDLLIKTAKEYGEILSVYSTDAKGKKHYENSYNKIRGFFDEVASIKEAMNNGYCSPEEAQEKIELMLSRVYKRTETGTVNKDFRNFFETNVMIISKTYGSSEIKKAINAFANHYEAVVGFTTIKN